MSSPHGKGPDAWKQVRFGDVVRNANDTTRNREADGLERVVGLTHLDSGSLPVRRWDVRDESTSFTRTFRAGQVLFGKRRAYQRKVGLPEFEGICSGDILVFESKSPDLLPEFLPYVVQSNAFFERAVGTSAGSLSPRTKWQDLAKYEFALPPVDEQKRLASVLTQMQVHAERLRDAAEAATQVVLAVGSEEVKRNGACAWVQLGEVAEVVGGVTLNSRKAFSSDAIRVPYLRVANVLRGRLDLTDVTETTVERATLDELALVDGDVLLNEGGDRDQLGRGWVWEGQLESCVHQNHVFRARIHDMRVQPYYLAWLTNYYQAWWFEAFGSQSTNLASINRTQARKFPIPLLPARSQARVVETIHAQRQLESATREAIEQSRAFQQAMLAELWG